MAEIMLCIEHRSPRTQKPGTNITSHHTHVLYFAGAREERRERRKEEGGRRELGCVVVRSAHGISSAYTGAQALSRSMDARACTSDDILSFDERQPYQVFPKQDPRVRTLIQEVRGEGEHEAFLLTQTTARVFATKEVVVRAIEGPGNQPV